MTHRDDARTSVMFDMDGLLVDSEPLWLEAETAVMARLGADWTPADQVQLLGGSLNRTVRYLLGKARRPPRPGRSPTCSCPAWSSWSATTACRSGRVPANC